MGFHPRMFFWWDFMRSDPGLIWGRKGILKDLCFCSPSPSPRVQSQTEGEPMAQPLETVYQPASSVASRVMSLHRAAGKIEISATVQH